jgi:Na+-driven multidrug efflux pump
VFLFLSNTLAAVLRGTGNMIVQSRVYGVGAVLIVALSPALIMGWGPLPQLGTTGAALAVVLYYIGSTAVLGWYILSGRALVKFSSARLAPRWDLLVDILKVGAVASLNAGMTNITVGIITAILGTVGAAAIAGYGIGVRLEYLLIPLVFGLGGPLVAMVGSNIGAGQGARARRAAWIGGAIAFAVTEAIGLAAAIFPAEFLGLFTDEAQVIATGTTYFRIVGPVYGFFGGGMALYFASQGTGSMTWPFLGGVFRLLVANGGGWLAFNMLDAGEAGLFAAVAVGIVVFGAVNAAAVALSPAWRRGTSVRP